MRTILRILLVLILAPLAVLLYSNKIEPKLLSVETIELESGGVADGFTVAVISDTHIKKDFTEEDLAKVVKKVNEQRPNVVLFLGDLFDNYKEYDGDTESIKNVMAGINAELKLCVYGNHDYGGSAQKVYKKLMTDAGFTIFKNQSMETEYGINFLGLDDYIFGTDEGDGKLSESSYNFVFAHAPDSADKIKGYDFFIAGHSHGGQVKLPFIKPFVLPVGAKKYWGGMCENSDGSKLYVTRGIGTSIYPLRFNSVPEITICKFSKKGVEK